MAGCLGVALKGIIPALCSASPAPAPAVADSAGTDTSPNVPVKLCKARNSPRKDLESPSSSERCAEGEWNQEGSDGDEVLPERGSAPVPSTTPRSSASTEASSIGFGSQKESYSSTIFSRPSDDALLTISADATLVDGLRCLLLHHMKKGLDSDVTLTATQAELFEQHLDRLASYAGKIVSALSFSMHFLTKHKAGWEPDESEVPLSERQEDEQPKTLKLDDNDILDIYRSAQHEAMKEADWRGVDEDGQRQRIADSELVRVLSRAMQQPGRTPEAFASELASHASFLGCCRPEPTNFHDSSAKIRWPQVPPDPDSDVFALGTFRFPRDEIPRDESLS